MPPGLGTHTPVVRCPSLSLGTEVLSVHGKPLHGTLSQAYLTKGDPCVSSSIDLFVMRSHGGSGHRASFRRRVKGRHVSPLIPGLHLLMEHVNIGWLQTSQCLGKHPDRRCWYCRLPANLILDNDSPVKRSQTASSGWTRSNNSTESGGQ